MKALVTGASSGIGKEIALYLSSLGYDLILVARSENKLKELKKQIKTNVTIYKLDLSIMKNIEYLYNEVKKEDIDILVNNAGFGLFGSFDKTDINKEFGMIDLNIKSYHYLTKLFIKDFIKKDKGYILNVSSSASFMAGPNLSTYYATKNYVTRLSEAIYHELKEMNSNVHISILCPGPVDTNFNNVAGSNFKNGISPKYVAKYAIDNMFKNRLIIIPSLKVRLGVFFLRFIPLKIQLKYIYKFQQNKVNNK